MQKSHIYLGPGFQYIGKPCLTEQFSAYLIVSLLKWLFSGCSHNSFYFRSDDFIPRTILLSLVHLYSLVLMHAQLDSFNISVFQKYPTLFKASISIYLKPLQLCYNILINWAKSYTSAWSNSNTKNKSGFKVNNIINSLLKSLTTQPLHEQVPEQQGSY